MTPLWVRIWKGGRGGADYETAPQSDLNCFGGEPVKKRTPRI